MLRFVLVFVSFYMLGFAGSKSIVIDLSQQYIYALEEGRIVMQDRISSGKKGHETPNGTFRILQKKRLHRSNLWPKPNGGAKMPYMLRLTNDGIAIHAGHVPKHPASHGCIRLRPAFAKRLFRWAKVGTPVRIDGSASVYVDRMRFGGKQEGGEYAIIDFHTE